MVHDRSWRRGYVFGLTAAVLFGASAPLSKRLLDDVTPQLLAGLLYLGAFAGLSLVRRSTRESPLQRNDLPRLSAMIISGGVLAPVMLLLGLQRVSGVTGSLLLNLEGPLTIVIGVALFREHLPRQAATGAAIIFGGALLLRVEPGSVDVDGAGIALVAAACALWALDNNLTQALTVRDPLSIVRIKAGAAGIVNMTLALLLGATLPDPTVLAAVLVVGAFGYGLSVYLDALALRHLGAAREAAVFAVAPFSGALLAPLVLPESIGAVEVAAGMLMAIGLAVLLRAEHVHHHAHEPIVHDHVHVTDDHHRHEHPGGTADEPHAHPHVHDAVEHAHSHVSDAHHRHAHKPRDR